MTDVSRRTRLFLFFSALAICAGIFLIDLNQRIRPTVVYVIVLAMLAWTRSPRMVWTLAVLCVPALFIGMLHGYKSNISDFDRLLNRVVIALALLQTAALIHVWIRSFTRLEDLGKALGARNQEMVVHEEEIARQNEELQSQTEELERQGEELRVTNDELSRRDRALQALLDLSRSLNAGLGVNETMTRLCSSLARFIDAAGVASAVVLREGEEVVVRCHHGFGPDGLERERWAFGQSFVRMVMERDQVAFIEDIELRQDLVFAQPAAGARLRSVLAAPIRIRGLGVGVIEVHSTGKLHWSEDQVAMIESLAAQASVSLEAGQMFDEIEAQRTRFETVFRTLPIGVAMTDEPMAGLRFNPAGAAIFHVEAEAVVPIHHVHSRWPAWRDGEPLAEPEHPIRRAIVEGEVIAGEELEFTLPGGRRISLLAAASPIRNPAGRIVAAVAAFVDITAQKELQREIDARRREAEEASVRKTRFLAAVSHDIRTPTNAINLMAELLKRAAGNPAMAPQLPEMALDVQRSAATLSELVTDVLDIARFDSGKIDLQESDFALGPLLDEEVRQLLPLAIDRKLKLMVAPSSPLTIRADRVKLARVLANLVGNAIKFTSEGGVVIGQRRTPDLGLEIWVEDTGIGIPPEHLERIFDEFYQIRNPERDRNKGTGLGLAICHRIVVAMGGSIHVASVPAKGSTFTLRFGPALVIADRDDVPAIVRKLPALEAPAGRRLSGMRMLLVEDHHATRRATARLLQVEGAEVHQAADGKSALELLQKVDPHMVLLDLMLPDMNGRQILASLREHRPAALRGTFILTGDTVSQAELEINLQGADGLFSKPVDMDDLLERLAQVAATA